ncbi:MAG: DUF1015 domain-containing protein [Deltaproteobacteria bacterium]|nr:DUF1015 domain-containing protein [Deltaproteobacteria bacterium]
MAFIAPFKGLTYNFNALDEISRLVAPPYDVISEQEQEGYYEVHPHNVIRLILAKKKTGDSDWDNRYTRAADDFQRWLSADVLVRSDQPAMYVTSLSYDPRDGGGPRVRWGLIALVRIEEDESGVILPHERTFSAHKDDRLKLMRAANAQFSQIFGLYEDPEGSVFRCFADALAAPPRVSFDFKDGTSHRMWIVNERSVFRAVAAAMAQKSIFIADGHHRYETARNFRNIMRARYGRLSPNRSYEYVMMYLSNMDDAGLTVLPSHRLIKRCEGFRVDSFFERVDRWFEVSALPIPPGGGESKGLDLKRRLEEKGRGASAIAFHCRGGRAFSLLTLRPGARREMGDDLHPSLKELDVLVLSRFILQKSLGFTREDLDDEEIFHYESNLEKAVSMVDSGEFLMAFILNPTRIEHVKEVAGNGLIMPRKSTYFYPKVLTGLVFNRIEPYEVIEEF